MKTFKQVTQMTGLFAAEYMDMESKEVVDETFRIFVGKPYVIESDRKYPVIYMLDGNGMFASVMEMQRLMAISNEIPPAFVVGIGYAVEGEGAIDEVMNKRSRDYTPNSGGELENITSFTSDPTNPVPHGGGLFPSWVLLNPV